MSLHGQTVRVVDAVTGYPIQDVVAYNNFTKNNATSDADGQLDLSVFSVDDELFFEHIGYESLIAVVSEVQLSKQISLYPDTQRLREIVLSVSRTKDEKKRVSKQVAIISDRDIASIVPNTSAELLREAPGIRIQRSQGGGGSPVIRGFEANRLLLVVDGVRLNNAIYRSGHLQNSITIHPNIIERVEVVYGSSSVGYGSDALGGVIHYYTKSPLINNEKKINTQLSSDYSTGTKSYINSISTELSFKKWASLTSLSFSDFGDIRMGRNRPHGYQNWGLNFLYSSNTRDTYSSDPIINKNPLIQKNTKSFQNIIRLRIYINWSYIF